MFIPYRVDVPMERVPWANFGLLVAMILTFIVEQQVGLSTWSWMILRSWQPWELITYQFLHGDILHLFGNGLFLWLFGNAVCAKVGNLPYLLIFLACGAVAGLAHMVIDGQPVVGASGSINGVVGLFLILFPRNSISVLFIFFPVIRVISMASWWMIVFWFIGDVYGALVGGAGVAYVAHLGGFAAGFLTAWYLICHRGLRSAMHEENLLEIYHWGPYAPGADASRYVRVLAEGAVLGGDERDGAYERRATVARDPAATRAPSQAVRPEPRSAPQGPADLPSLPGRLVTNADFADAQIASIAAGLGVSPDAGPTERPRADVLALDCDLSAADEADDDPASPAPITIEADDFRPPPVA